MNHPITYAECRPREELSAWVQCLWTFDARQMEQANYEHYVPPDACVAILQNLSSQRSNSPIILVGPRWEPTQISIQAGDFYHGVRFLPYAARSVLGPKLDEWVSQARPLQFLKSELAVKIMQTIGGQTSELNDRKKWHDDIQDVLLSHLTSSDPLDDLARRATARIVESGGNVGLEQLSQELDISLRQLQRRFIQSTGMTLKQFARIRRFREAASELLQSIPRSWCDVSVDAGYADQAHLTREFVQLVGLPPKQLQARYEAIFHDSVEP